MPFGMARGTANVASETNYQYTGQEYDAETGLYWYGSRYYDSVIGRFVMADTMVPDITSTQALNPYSYCLNNPLKYTDLTGHSAKEKKVNVNSPKFLAGLCLTMGGLGWVIITALICVLVVAITSLDGLGLMEGIMETPILTGAAIAAIGALSMLAGIPTLVVAIYQSPSVEPDVLTDFTKIYTGSSTLGRAFVQSVM